MNVARSLPVRLVAILTLLGVSACDLIPQTQNTYQPPPPDKIEKAQNRVTLNGRVLVVKEGNIWLLTQDSFKQITSGGRSRQAAWSPAAKEVAFVKMGDSSSDIWLMNADGSNARAITQFRSTNLKSNHWAFQPTWSPDGKQIAYVSEESSFDLALWVMNADGSGRRQIIALDSYSGGIDNPTWSPDGARMAITAYRGPTPQIWVFTLKTGDWQQITKNPEGAYDASWSPDGKRLAYVARNTNKNDIWIINADGSAPVQVTTSGLCRAPTWSPDGLSLGYFNGQGGYFDFWVVKITLTETGIKLGDAEGVTKNAQLDPASGISWSK